MLDTLLTYFDYIKAGFTAEEAKKAVLEIIGIYLDDNYGTTPNNLMDAVDESLENLIDLVSNDDEKVFTLFINIEYKTCDRASLSFFGCCHEMVKHRESRRCETNDTAWLFGGPDAAGLQQLTSARINRCIGQIEADINAENKVK